MLKRYDKTTEQNNRMIAEFMGFKFAPRLILPDELKDSTYSTSVFVEEVRIQGGFEPNSYNNLHFHTSWDWLIPVVEKINTLFGGEMNTLIMSNSCKIYSDNPSIYNSIVDANSTIEATYQAVCQFIEWYNENK